MNLPFEISKTNSFPENNRLRFSNERQIRSNVWRRHQVYENRIRSGWVSDKDNRRRILHFSDKYEIIDDILFLLSPYLFLHYKL